MYNAYNYNPYMQPRYMQQPQQIEQTMQQSLQPMNNANRTNVKQVDSVEMAKNSEYLLDGSINYFIITDGSAIVSKQMTIDGTPKITIFKPILDEKDKVKYITQDDMKKALNELNFDELDEIKDEISNLKKELKDLKKKGKINNE